MSSGQSLCGKHTGNKALGFRDLICFDELMVREMRRFVAGQTQVGSAIGKMLIKPRDREIVSKLEDLAASSSCSRSDRAAAC